LQNLRFIDSGDHFLTVAKKRAHSKGNDKGDTDETQQQLEQKTVGVFAQVLNHNYREVQKRELEQKTDNYSQLQLCLQAESRTKALLAIDFHLVFSG
jgi:hypothetical protein